MCKVFINPEACGSYDLRYNGIDEIGNLLFNYSNFSKP
jgi:hypothetical protein